MSDATPEAPATTPAADPREPVGPLTLQPPCPYEVDVLVYGGHPMPTRRYPDGSHGAILTADEIAVWEHLQAVRSALYAAQTVAAFDVGGAAPDPDAAAADAARSSIKKAYAVKAKKPR